MAKQHAQAEPGILLTMERKSESLEASVENFIDSMVDSQLEDFTNNLEIARSLYRGCPDLVTAPEFPEPFRSLCIEHHGAEPSDDAEHYAPPLLFDRAALRESLRPEARTMALALLCVKHNRRSGRA